MNYYNFFIDTDIQKCCKNLETNFAIEDDIYKDLHFFNETKFSNLNKADFDKIFFLNMEKIIHHPPKCALFKIG